MRLIFKTSSVTPGFFYVFNLILSFSTCSQSFKKICVWELLGANVLKSVLSIVLRVHSHLSGDLRLRNYSAVAGIHKFSPRLSFFFFRVFCGGHSNRVREFRRRSGNYILLEASPWTKD